MPTYNLEDLIAEIKSTNISNIVGRYCRLVNAGGLKRKACCPFHHEKTPSFYVDDREGYYKCFGCGEGGDVIKFIQKKHSCDFKQAIDLLCEMLGIDKSKYIQQDEQQVEKQATFFETMKVVSDYYKQCLTNDKDAKEYVLNIRNLAPETINEFGIGLAKNDIPDMLRFCQERGINEDAVIDSGILRRSIKETSFGNNKYLFFRDRIMIPIQNVSGKIVAFGGRIYKTGDDNAKYLNSSENDNFKKGQILFNLHRAKRQLTTTNQLIVVEGYMDVIALWQGGFKTGIAPLGTSITEQHLKTILNYSKSPIFIFDSDLAGQKASMRACEMLFSILQTGFIPRFLTLQGAKDCDEFLHKYSAESLQSQLDNALEINEFVLQKKSEKYNIANPNQKAKLQKEIEELLKHIPDEILRRNYQQYFKDKFWKMDYKIKNNKFNKFNSANNFNSINRISKQKTTINKVNIDTLEKQIIAVILQHKELLEDDELSNNVIARFLQRNQTLLNQMLIEESKDKIETFCNRYKVDNTANIETNFKTIISNLSIAWEIQYINNSNLPSTIKKTELKKVLERKKKNLKQIIETDE